MKKILIPNLKEIMKPVASHKFGYGIKTETGKFYKQEILEQGSTPEEDILKKLGIKKKENVLSIATYYASWASHLARLGVRVDYSDISKSMVNWAKKEYKNLFGRYIISNYELIPKKEKEYDWTFTFEACGGKRGLSIAYLRSLLNNRGGILTLVYREHALEKMGSKLKQYRLIVEEISRIYSAKSSIKKVKIKSHIKGQETKENIHFIYKIKTNNSARKKAKRDLEILDKIQNKSKINLRDIAKKLKINQKELKYSLLRINKVSELIEADNCVKEVEIND